MSHRKRRGHKGRHPRAHGSRAGNLPLGTLQIVGGTYGFVDTEEGSFFIPGQRLGGAMQGDTVEVRPSSGKPEPGRNRRGSVVRVHRRAVEYVAGTLEVADPLTVVRPNDPRIPYDIFITEDTCPEAVDGDVVLARITTYPHRRTAAQGYIVEVLGRADAPGMDVDMLVHSAGLPGGFSPAALEEAAAVELDIEGALAEPDRRDLRGRDVFTIDPSDAKDFDDAISLDRVEGLTRLGVHIADVSSYVPWESSLDIAARDRSTSVYLVDRVLPMLPEELSCDICSLRPGADRLTMTCDLYLDSSARVVRHEVYPSVIRSRRRFDYDEVQGILDACDALDARGAVVGADAPAGPAHDPYARKLLAFRDVARMLVRARVERGALDFDSAEAKVRLDEEGHPVAVEVRAGNEATSMIEEAMILANRTVATLLSKRRLPAVYRVHESPRAKAMEALVPLLRQLGYPVEGLAGGEPRAFQQVLDRAKGRPEEELVGYQVLRSMERARYDVEPQGHFGLALEHYCHFTSPIRRYPDLMVHRLLRDPHAMEGQLEWLAEHASRMERVAEQAERDSVRLKLCEYMEGHVGEVFEATISTVLAGGFFVRLDNTVEGFVRFDAWRDEHHEFDPRLQTLVGEETGRTYRFGQCLRVRLVEVDVREQRIDFALA